VATNRWYDNTTNILVEFTVARATDVESKFDDVANAFDALEAEYDAALAGANGDISDLSDRVDAEAVRVKAGAETPDLLITDAAAARANKVLAFDAGGDIEVRQITAAQFLQSEFTQVSGNTTLALNYAYNLQPGSYTVTLPTPVNPGDWILIKMEDGVNANPPTVDGDGTDIEGNATLEFDVNFGEMFLQFNGTEWKV